MPHTIKCLFEIGLDGDQRVFQLSLTLKICSVVLHFGRKPACCSDSNSSALPLSQLSMILIRLIVL